MASLPHNLEHALYYARNMGCYVFPSWGITGHGICACLRGVSCPHPAKHPCTPHGFRDATNDPQQITAFWRRYPGANVSIATRPSGLLVVDQDLDEGKGTWKCLTDQYGSPPPTHSVITPRDGLHLYYLCDVPIPSSSGQLGPKLDIRCSGAYVIAPPSIGKNGKPYRWVEADNFAPAPNWLIKLAQKNTQTKRNPKEPSKPGIWQQLKSPIPQGARNDTLFRLAAWLRLYHPEVVVQALVMVINDARCHPPLDAPEVISLVHSAYSYSQPGVGGHPRAVIPSWTFQQ